MGEFSISHWLIILVILLIFFGPSRLPDLGKSLGKAIRGFKDSMNEPPTPTKAQSTDRIATRPTEGLPGDARSESEASVSYTKNKTEV